MYKLDSKDKDEKSWLQMTMILLTLQMWIFLCLYLESPPFGLLHTII